MANEKVVFKRGTTANLPTTKTPGTVLLDISTGAMYVDDTSSSRIQVKDPTKLGKTETAEAAKKLKTAVNIDGFSFDGSANINHYATCSTAAATVAKVATINTGTFTLVTGSTVYIKFTNANSVANATLNVNSTGAKAIYYNGSAILQGYIKAGGLYQFVYDGTNWVINGGIDTDQQIDTKVVQTPTSDDVNYQAIFSNSSATYAEDAQVRKSVKFLLNPSSGNFVVREAGDDISRRVIITPTGIKLWPHKSASWAGGITWCDNGGENILSVLGCYGTADPTAIGYFYFGKAYNDPWLKITPTDDLLTTEFISEKQNVFEVASEALNDVSIVLRRSAASYRIINTGGLFQIQGNYETGVVGDWVNFFQISTSGNSAFTGTVESPEFIGDLTGTASNVYGTLTNPTTATTYAIPFHTGPSSDSKALLNNNGLRYYSLEGTTDVDGSAQLRLGNGLASGTAANKTGTILMYGDASYSATIQPISGMTANRTYTLPNASGTIALTSQLSDTKVNVTLATTTKAYLLGVSTTPTSTATAMTAVSDTGVYLDTTAGKLTATSFAGSGASLTSLNASNISSGTLEAARLATSGVTAASYGPSANVSPTHSGTFSVPYITVDKYGRVTAASTKTITLPSSGNTDVNVKQTLSETTNFRPILLGTDYDADPSLIYNESTGQAYTASGIYVKPSTGHMYAASFHGNLYLKDKTDTEYVAINDNGTNMWIGAEQQVSTHHNGGTFISTGYDTTNSTGFETIRFAVPNDTNTSSEIYYALHSGNYMNYDGHLRQTSMVNDSSTAADTPWYKIATMTSTIKSTHAFMILAVTDGMSGGIYGILHIKLASSSSEIGKHNTGSATWMVVKGISEENFVVTYTENVGTSITYEVWCKIPTQWHSYVISVINEGSRTTGTHIWTLCEKTTTGVASYGTPTGTIVSTKGAINNPLTIKSNTSDSENYVFFNDPTSSGNLAYDSYFTFNPSGNGLTIKNTNGTRSAIFHGGGMKIIADSETGWASGTTFYTSDGTTTIGAMGVYGAPDGESINYMYLGKSYNDPWMKLTESLTTSLTDFTILKETPTLTLDANSNATVSIVLKRSASSWQILNTVGEFVIQGNYKTGAVGDWYNAFKFSSSGNATFTGTVTAPEFIGDLTGNADSATKVYGTLTNPTTATSYPIPFHTGISSANKSLLNNNGLRYYSLEGTTADDGIAQLRLGNGTATGADSNKTGSLLMYGNKSYYSTIENSDDMTGNITLTIPKKSGTIALTSDANKYNYGTCTTAADTVEKVVTCSGFTSLATGAEIVVKFTNTNTVAAPTLNVNSTGAKPIYYDGSALTATNASKLYAGGYYTFRYNGTQWCVVASSPTYVYNTFTEPTSKTTYNLAFVNTSATSAYKSMRINDGVKCYITEGTTTTDGYSVIQLGNATASGTEGNKSGYLRLYNNAGSYTLFKPGEATGTVTITLPETSGTVALTSELNKVTQGVTTSANYRPLLMGYTNSSDINDLDGSTTNTTFVINGLAVKPSTGELHLPSVLLQKGKSIPYATNGAKGYYCIAQFVIKSTYFSSPIELVISDRNTSVFTTFYIRFTHTNSTDPTLTNFNYKGAVRTAYLCKSATSTWQLWVNDTAGYHTLAVVNLRCSKKDSMTVTYPGTHMTVDDFETAIATGGSLETNTVVSLGSAYRVAAANQWVTTRNINGMAINGTSNRVNYGSCSTAKATVAKTVECSGFALVTGAEITVKFTNGNTASNATLNVNSTGAKAIYYNGAALPANEFIIANGTYTFRYNGTQYDLVGTDENVMQVEVSNHGEEYRVLFSYDNSDNNVNSYVKKNSVIRAIPNTGLKICSDNRYNVIKTSGMLITADTESNWANGITFTDSTGEANIGWVGAYGTTDASAVDYIGIGTYYTNLWFKITSTEATFNTTVKASMYQGNIYQMVTNPTSSTTYNIPFVTHSSTSQGLAPRINDGLRYYTLQGTTSAAGYGVLQLGNATASGTAGNKSGYFRLYGTSSGYTILKPGYNSTASVTITLPSSSGTLALTSQVSNVKQTDLACSPTNNYGLRLPILLGSKATNPDNSYVNDETMREIELTTTTSVVNMTGLAWVETNYYTTSGEAGSPYATICANNFKVVGTSGNFDGDLLGNANTATRLKNGAKINGVEFFGNGDISLSTVIYEGTSSSNTIELAEDASNYDALIVQCTHGTFIVTNTSGYTFAAYGESPPPSQHNTTVVGSLHIHVSGTTLIINLGKHEFVSNSSTVTPSDNSSATAYIYKVIGLHLM